uniref:Uncharacterized protein MANES_11G069200 n=1 Tax=Rhizophora mucronata TaxID=61149 RepID=A0A2P2KRS4_RHIMU
MGRRWMVELWMASLPCLQRESFGDLEKDQVLVSHNYQSKLQAAVASSSMS